MEEVERLLRNGLSARWDITAYIDGETYTYSRVFLPRDLDYVELISDACVEELRMFIGYKLGIRYYTGKLNASRSTQCLHQP